MAEKKKSSGSDYQKRLDNLKQDRAQSNKKMDDISKNLDRLEEMLKEKERKLEKNKMPTQKPKDLKYRGKPIGGKKTEHWA